MARVNKPSSNNNNNPCVMPQSINVILIPFTNLNSVVGLAALLRSILGLVVDTSSGTPTLSILVWMSLLPIIYFDILLNYHDDNFLLLDCCNTYRPCFYQSAGEQLFDVVVHREVENSGQSTCDHQNWGHERSQSFPGAPSNKRWE